MLDDIANAQVEQVIVAGDLCKGGPDPSGVIRLLKEHDCRCVYGNTDRDLVQDSRGSDPSSQWGRSQLDVTDLHYLESLPFSIRIPHQSADDEQASDLLVVHANPLDVDRHLSPNASDRELLELIGGESAHTIAFGHLHVSYTREVGDKMLVDVSAVGQPRDGDLRPRYVIFDDEQDTGQWSHQYRYVDYPVDSTRKQLRDSGMPNWEQAFDQLMSAR